MIELLSKSTQHIDKSEKLEEYQSLDILEKHLMISQTEPHIMIYHKIQTNKWEQEIIKDLNQTIQLNSIDAQFVLKGRYEEVNFTS